MIAFLPVENGSEQQAGNNELAEENGFLYKYSSSTIVEVRDWISVISSTDGREVEIEVLDKIMLLTLSEIEEICFCVFYRRTG